MEYVKNDTCETCCNTNNKMCFMCLNKKKQKREGINMSLVDDILLVNI